MANVINQAGPHLIYVVDDDTTQAEELSIQLNYFGYEVRIFDTLEAFRSAMRQNHQVVVLMELDFPDGSNGGIKAIKEIRQELKVSISVIYLTAQHDLATRLEAVRAGGSTFLNHPIKMGSLLDKLAAIASNLPTAPFRILIVDQSESLTARFSNIIEQAGMRVAVVNKPFEMLKKLVEFNPDLILLETDMQECNASELSKVIRQFDSFASIPIVFLTHEKEHDAMSMGADDFISSEIQPQQLINSLTGRIRRFEGLRSLMLHDSRTGLLSQASLMDHLVREMAQTRRRGTPLAFAMIELDNFKQINDTNGLQAGDYLIDSLASLLEKRLRETDTVGRYGDFGFAVILSNTNGETAMTVLEAIRKDFSQLYQLEDGKEIAGSFSCGLADVFFFDDSAKLRDAAFKLLNKAMQAGGDRVTLGNL